MGHLLFSPSGRISPDAFMKGALVLIVIAALISLTGLVSQVLASILGILSLITIYCWVVLFIKRYHEGSQSGWMVFIPSLVYLVLVTVVTIMVFWSELADIFVQMLAAAESGDTADPAELEAQLMETLASPAMILKSTLAVAAVSALVAWFFNKIIPVDPNDNMYGPGPGQRVADPL